MNEELRQEFIKDEYLMLQGFYEDIDNRCITIKGWSITVGIAALSAGFVYSHRLFLGAVLSSLLFWYLEGYWRGLSYFFARRILEIEAGIRETGPEKLVPLQVYDSWNRTFQNDGKQTWRYMRKEISLMPHWFILLVGLLLFFAGSFGWL